MAEISLVKLPAGKCHWTLLMISQHFIRQEAITWANVDPDLCHHMTSLGLNELRREYLNSLRLSDAYMRQLSDHHCFDQCWNIVNWNLRNKLQWNLNPNSNIFIQENAFESVVCEKTAIFSRPQCVKLGSFIPLPIPWWDLPGNGRKQVWDKV